MEESAVIFAAYDVWYGEDMRERLIKNHPLVSSASHNSVQQAADLVFEPTMKRSQKREKSNFERNFLTKKQ